MRTIPPIATDIEVFFDGENTEITYMNGDRANFHSFIGENKIVGNQIVKVINNLIN